MKLPLFELDTQARNDENCVIAIGIFDGVHRGHLQLLSSAKKLAKKHKAKLFTLTFHPHPDTVLRGDDEPTKLIYPVEIRAEILTDREGFLIPESCAADKVFVKNFTPEFASESADSFLKFLKDKFPNLKALVTGENFKFGKGAVADVEWLKQNAANYGIETLSVKGLEEDGALVSSTRLRSALTAGDMEEFTQLTERPYFAEGVVCEGRKLGRKIGFPTLNIKWSQECVPPFGVYAAGLVNLDSGQAYAGVANYGVNPTVGATEPQVETHLFSDVDFGAGTRIQVNFLEFIRPEMKFASLEDLAKQIRSDKSAAQELWQSGLL